MRRDSCHYIAIVFNNYTLPVALASWLIFLAGELKCDR